MTRDKLNDILMDMGAEGAVMMDGYEDAAIGLTLDNQVVYDYDAMILVLQQRDGMTQEEALEWIDYNTIRALNFVPLDKRPIIITPIISEP